MGDAVMTGRDRRWLRVAAEVWIGLTLVTVGLHWAAWRNVPGAAPGWVEGAIKHGANITQVMTLPGWMVAKGLKLWLHEDAKSHGLDVTFVDTSRIENIAAAIQPGRTKMIWLETPANPLWTLSDIAAASALAKANGAILGVDSTVATPVLSQPLKLGADVVMHAATKYLNGHSDVVAGSLTFARMDAYFERAERLRKMLGGILGPFEAMLLIRGMRTLHLRVAHQSRAAMSVAKHFAADPRVAEVLYPGLPSHPNHDIAVKQMHGGFSGMLSVRVKAGTDAAIRTAAQVKIWKRATSLGGVESLIEHRASVEGAGSPCPPDLLRLSVGLEHVDDLIADLDQALGTNA